jgi:TDG/mug DNA glycosylase family protein
LRAESDCERRCFVIVQRVLAVLGVGAYRTAFNQPKAVVGRQEEQIGEHDALGLVLPNPSGLNANYQLSFPS